MALKQQIEQEMKVALKAKDKQKLGTLRAIKSEILLLETSGKGDVTEEDEIKMLKKMRKQRKESAEIYQKEGRTEAAEEELAEAKVIEGFLPEEFSQEEIKKVVQEVISETGASSMKDMGKVMGMATKRLAGKADNKMVSELVKAALGN